MKDVKNRSLLMCATLTFALSLLSSVNFVSADDSSSSTDSPEISREKVFIKKMDKNEMKERLNDRKEKIKEKIEEMKENENDFEDKFDNRRSKINNVRFGTSTDERSTSAASTSPIRIKIAEKIKKQNKKIVEKLDKDVKKLEDLYEKISSKISKFEEKGVLVTEARALMDIAILKIDAAKSGIDDIVSKPAVKIEIVKIRGLTKTAQDSLIDVVKALKPGLNKQKNTSSSASSNGVSSASSSVI